MNKNKQEETRISANVHTIGVSAKKNSCLAHTLKLENCSTIALFWRHSTQCQHTDTLQYVINTYIIYIYIIQICIDDIFAIYIYIQHAMLAHRHTLKKKNQLKKLKTKNKLKSKNSRRKNKSTDTYRQQIGRRQSARN